MKVIMTFLLVLLGISAYAISIYDIQYTSASGIDNTYPSPYLGKAVTIEGIVTAINLHSGGYFLSEANGGMWRSIHISDKRAMSRLVIESRSVALWVNLLG
jgi:hypothetical protein